MKQRADVLHRRLYSCGEYSKGQLGLEYINFDNRKNPPPPFIGANLSFVVPKN